MRASVTNTSGTRCNRCYLQSRVSHNAFGWFVLLFLHCGHATAQDRLLPRSRPIGNGTVEAANVAGPQGSVDRSPQEPKQTTSDPATYLLPEERVAIGVYAKCNRSVVHISTKSVAMDSFLQVHTREGGGSGSVIDKQGIILTNQHVIDGAREITVSLFNGLAYPATLVGQDADTDIAVLKIEAPAEQLEPVDLGDSTTLLVGQRIYAIGNPFGLERTMSAGMISSLNRQIPSRERRTMFSLIQIDASINQGNSGGPLFNTRGQLIGMNTAIMSSDGDSAGVGFAIPSSTIGRIVPQLIQHGRVLRPTTGIRRVYENEQGLLIVLVVPGSPADQAGLRGFRLVTRTVRQGQYEYSQPPVLDTSQADLIIGVDGRKISTADELMNYIESKRPGEQIRLEVIRDQRQVSVPLVLGESS